MVSAAQFLASVTSSADGSALAAEVSAGRLEADARGPARLVGRTPMRPRLPAGTKPTADA